MKDLKDLEGTGPARKQADLSQLKVAIVHDWLIGGGAEKVVLELHHMFPDAPVYTSYATDEWREKLDGKVITGWLQHFGKLRKFMVLGRIWWFSRLKLDDYDLVITSSGNGEAFAVKTGPDTLHVNYCHTPTHYYWRHYNQYMSRPGFGVFDPLARLGLKLLVSPLRKWDYKAAQRADVMIANSTHIQADIKQFYGRDAVVVHPPVDTAKISGVKAAKRSGFIASGRLATPKRVDIIVDAASQLGLPLKVVGTGPAYNDLVKRAGPSVELLGFVDDASLYQLWASSEAFIFASYDDFGISPVEAMAAGTPVIAYKAGGSLDYVVPGKTGEFFEEQSIESLKKTLETFDSSKYDAGDIKAAARSFSIDSFHKNMLTVLKNVLQ